MNEAVDRIYYGQNGMKRVTSLKQLWKKESAGGIRAENREYLEQLFNDIYSRSLLASYYIMSDRHMSPEEIEDRLITTYHYDMPPETEDIKCDLIALLMSDNGTPKCAEVILAHLAEFKVRILVDDSKRAAKEFLETIESLIYDQDFEEFAAELTLRLDYFLVLAGFMDVARNIERAFIREFYYDFGKMNAYSRILAQKYVELLTGNGDGAMLAEFIRKFSPDFADYEGVFGCTGKELRIRTLNLKDTPITAYRILRGFYAESGSSQEWLSFILAYSGKENTKKWCVLYDFYTRLAQDAEDVSSEEAFYEKNRDEMAQFREYDSSEYDIKFFVELCRLYNASIRKGWDVLRMIDFLGPNSPCIYHLNFQYKFNKMSEADFKGDNEFSGKWLLSLEDAGMIMKIYMSTHLHQALSFRKVLNRIAVLSGSGIGDVMRDYPILGQVVNVDKYRLLKGLYYIQPLNVYLDRDERWEIIHSKYKTQEEKTRLCSTLLRSDEKAGTEQSARFRRDEYVIFSVTECEISKDRYHSEELPLIQVYVGNLQPYMKTAETGEGEAGAVKKTADGDADILDLAKDGLLAVKNIPPNELADMTDNELHNLLSGDLGNVVVSLKDSGRNKEFAMLIFETCIALSVNAEKLDWFLRELNANRYGMINEFFYKPGKFFYGCRLKFDEKETGYVRQESRKLMNADIPDTLKMKVYMNTLMKRCVDLDFFVKRLPGNGEEALFIAYKRKEYPYYVYSLKFLKESEQYYHFTFEEIAFSRKCEIVAPKDRLFGDITAEDVRKAKNRNTERNTPRLYGGIERIDAGGKIILSGVFYDQYFLDDPYTKSSNEIRSLYSCVRDSEYIRDKIDTIRSYRLDYSKGDRYEKLFQITNSFMRKMKLNREDLLVLFEAWENAPFSDEKLNGRLPANAAEEAGQTMQILMDAVREGSTDELMTMTVIYHRSFLKFFVTEEDFIRAFSQKSGNPEKTQMEYAFIVKMRGGKL